MDGNTGCTGLFHCANSISGRQQWQMQLEKIAIKMIVKLKVSIQQLAYPQCYGDWHIPSGITQCYLPPGRGDIPAFTPAKAGTRFSNPGGKQGWVDLLHESTATGVSNSWPINCKPDAPTATTMLTFSAYFFYLLLSRIGPLRFQTVFIICEPNKPAK